MPLESTKGECHLYFPLGKYKGEMPFVLSPWKVQRGNVLCTFPLESTKGECPLYFPIGKYKGEMPFVLLPWKPFGQNPYETLHLSSFPTRRAKRAGGKAVLLCKNIVKTLCFLHIPAREARRRTFLGYLCQWGLN